MRTLMKICPSAVSIVLTQAGLKGRARLIASRRSTDAGRSGILEPGPALPPVREGRGDVPQAEHEWQARASPWTPASVDMRLSGARDGAEHGVAGRVRRRSGNARRDRFVRAGRRVAWQDCGDTGRIRSWRRRAEGRAGTGS